MSDDEEWRDVPGFEGIYEVSSEGRVRSVDRVYVDKNGHPFDEANTIFTPKGSRRCLACKRASQTRRNHRLRGEPRKTRSVQ